MDIVEQAGLVIREVETREVDGRPARVVIASRAYETDIDDLWDALTNAERIPRWFMPISGDLRLGGRYQLEGNASGEISRCDPPSLLAVTWEMHGGVSWVTVRLSEAAEATRLELEHVAHVDDAFWNQYGPGAVGVGWDLSLLGLALHRIYPDRRPPESDPAWVAGPEGRAYIEASSAGWCRASIAAGTPEADARAAADRTTAFYTGG